uniref:Uncharacterized protein n=1 Tax=Sulfolobus neozealandicus TaxID=299422 RepID=Q5DVE6_9CREN|nr:hypothetical protein [Sulfolobus neozealandicus]
MSTVCPKCGKPYAFTTVRKRENNYYIYAVHKYVDEKGKTRRFECYIAPAKPKQSLNENEIKEALITIINKDSLKFEQIIENIIKSTNDIEKLTALYLIFDRLRYMTYLHGEEIERQKRKK